MAGSVSCICRDVEYAYWLPAGFDGAIRTDSTFCTAFDDVATKMLGVSADELELMDAEKFDEVIKQALHKTYIMKCRAQVDEENGFGERLNVTVLEAEPIDYAEEARMLIDAIDSLEHAPIDLTFSS